MKLIIYIRIIKKLIEYKVDIEEFIEKEKKYFWDRDIEYNKIIDLLTNGMYDLNTDNKAFNTKMFERSKAIEDLQHLRDIRQIKKELVQEIDKIKQSVRDKQKQDEQRVSILSRQVESLQAGLEQAQHASLTDGLTGIFNRKAFDSHISKMVEQSTDSRSPFCLLMLDVDHFKQINDRYGHQVGDRVLLAMVQKCKGEIRKNDFFARYGGEEFAIVLPTASLRYGAKRARSICKVIATSHYQVPTAQGHDLLSFTVSIGVSVFQLGDTADSLIERADKALYEAKETGRNQVVSEKQLSATAL
jgi:diguanylate cyclase